VGSPANRGYPLGQSTNSNMPRLMVRVGSQVDRKRSPGPQKCRVCEIVLAGQKKRTCSFFICFFVSFIDSIRLIADFTIFSISRGCAEPQKGCSPASNL
jgi:hypothetical protein